MPWATHYLSNAGTALIDTCIAMGKKRVEQGNLRRDLFYYLVSTPQQLILTGRTCSRVTTYKNNEDGHDPVSPPLSDVVAEAVLVIGAGADSTSLTLANILYFLMRHPKVHKRLREEVDTFYPRGENALASTYHPEMSFLDAVM